MLRAKATLSTTSGIPAMHARSSLVECNESPVSDVEEAVSDSVIDMDNDVNDDDGDDQVDEIDAAAWSSVDIPSSDATNFEAGSKYEIGGEVLAIVSGSASQYGSGQTQGHGSLFTLQRKQSGDVFIHAQMALCGDL